MFVEMLPSAPDETAEMRRQLCYDDIMRLNGKQTIYQMIQLADEVRSRGGVPREPAEYKKRYHARLMERIQARREALRSGQARPEDYLVPGALDMLSALHDRGLPMYLASGTPPRDRTSSASWIIW
jgi:phosphoglycolate phosphatase-like HAD superfamily hydrolase